MSASDKDAPGEATNIASQENVSPRNGQAAKNTSKSSVRHRASVACASCRERRIRCVVPQGQAECSQCRRAGTECIIKNDDERRRPISKAYTSSLSDRINLLEGMLLDKGVMPPPAAHPPKTRHDSQTRQPDDQKPPGGRSKSKQPAGDESPPGDVPSPPDSRNDEFTMTDGDHAEAMLNHMPPPMAKEDSPFHMLDSKQEDIVHRLLSTHGNLSFDQLSGRIRFFGPTANSHVYADSPDQFDSREPPEQVRRAERIIRSLTVDTHDYLMSNFWEYYNSVVQVIDRDAFEADRESQNPKFYSSFLHISILAMGYRGANMDRDDMRNISLGNRESTLHREAKYMLDIELERPGGIPSVQALLLLGDLECGVGRDNTGWMYSGMANRLAFDIGLHLDCRSNDMSSQEIQIRYRVMRACVIYDKYWALFLGRPTSIKGQDLGMDLLSTRLSQLSQDASGNVRRDIAMEVFEQLIELMELAGRIVETRDNNVVKSNDPTNIFAMSEAEDNAYLHVINLDRQLQNWYRRLPEHLSWKPANIKTAPYSFFLLHQQYHVSMILLHRPWAKYGSITGDGASTGSHPSPDSGMLAPEAAAQHPSLAAANHSIGMGDPHSMVHDSRTSLSRSICTQQAVRVARIFWQHRQRFDGRKIFVTGIQHAGTSAIALIAALAYQRSESERRTFLGYLEILSDALSDMSHTYHPAGRMDDLLRAVLTQLRSSVGEARGYEHRMPLSGMSGSARSGLSGTSETAYPTVPLRREAADTDFGLPPKRRRPGNSRRASEFSRPPPPYFTGPDAQPTPPHSAQAGHQFMAGVHHARHNSEVDSMLFSMGVGDGSGALNLGFLSGSAIDMDADEQDCGGRQGEDMSLVTPASETWGLGSMHSDHQPGAFDSGMGDWSAAPGPAGLSASSVLGQSAAISNGLMSGAPAFGMSKGGEADRNADMLAGSLGSNREGEMNGMSPVSLSGLVQSVEKAGGKGDGSGSSRNHELDFFSFS